MKVVKPKKDPLMWACVTVIVLAFVLALVDLLSCCVR
jgi:hypothetical protein